MIIKVRYDDSLNHSPLLTLSSWLAIITVPVLIMLLPGNLPGCTIFSVSCGQQAWMGNSEDWDARASMSTFPATDGGYGRVLFSFPDRYTQGGINDQGLAVDGTGSIRKLRLNREAGNPVYRKNILDEILLSCKSVEEAIALCRSNHLPVLRLAHLFIADANGDSAVIEAGPDGTLDIHRKQGNWQLLTNFPLSHPESGYFPCDRFDAASQLLESLPPDATTIHRVLEAVRLPNTAYAQIYDCTNQRIILFLQRNFSEAWELDLGELLMVKRVRHPLSEVGKLRPGAVLSTVKSLP